VSAAKKLGRDVASDIAKSASLVVVMKGKKVDRFKPAGKPAADLIDAMVGTTGNLRAPLLRRGKTVLVGFNEEIYTDILG
jgi:arsenate reductase-like glutaredoxin family protein